MLAVQTRAPAHRCSIHPPKTIRKSKRSRIASRTPSLSSRARSTPTVGSCRARRPPTSPYRRRTSSPTRTPRLPIRTRRSNHHDNVIVAPFPLTRVEGATMSGAPHPGETMHMTFEKIEPLAPPEHPAISAAKAIRQLHLDNIAMIDNGFVFHDKEGNSVNEHMKAS